MGAISVTMGAHTEAVRAKARVAHAVVESSHMSAADLQTLAGQGCTCCSGVEPPVGSRPTDPCVCWAHHLHAAPVRPRIFRRGDHAAKALRLLSTGARFLAVRCR